MTTIRPGAVVGGRFEIRSLAGSGGMGHVYRALDRISGAPVALKLLAHDGAHRARFRREAEVLAALDHPHVVRYLAHGDGSDGGPGYLAMEWIEGATLRALLTNARASVAESVALASRVARALGAAHRLGIVHRDVKPENLMLVEGRHDQVKVLDFGVALAPTAHGRMTRTGTPLGTIGYMAPEQVAGEPDIDARADVFALGAVLFECLTGQAPFSADHPLTVLAKIVLEAPPSCRHLNSAVPPELDQLVLNALSRERAGRPDDANALAEQLSRFDTLTESAPARPSLPPPSITADERVFLCAVVGDAPQISTDQTLGLDDFETQRSWQRQIASDFGGRLESLGSRGFVVLFTGRDDPSLVAERGARAALALAADAPDLAIGVVAGRSGEREHLPVARAVDRAVSLLAGRDRAGVVIDETMAGLLSARFVVRDDDRGPLLDAELGGTVAHRLLLGNRTRCVGRTREIETLRAIWDECRDESVARVVLMTGPPGIGKSRICRELRGVLGDADVWVGRGDVTRAGTPLALVSDLLRDALGLTFPTREANQVALGTEVARHSSGVEGARTTAFLAELAGIPLADAALPELRAARADSILMRDQMRRAFEDLVLRSAAAQPLVVVLDDLHFGDLPSAQLIDAALRQAAELPFLVIGIGRPEVHSSLPRLWVERGVEEIRVGPLARRPALELAAAALPDAAQDTLHALVELAAGNPLYLEELVRAHAEGRTEAPDSVIAMVRARLDSVDPEGRRVLRAGSVFGMDFWRGALATLLSDLPLPRLDARLDALVARELIVPTRDSRFAGERQYSFCHDLVREAAHSMLTDDDSRLGHRLGAAWLERVGERDARLLAEHHELGGSPTSAIPWWERAATGALEANDFERARAFVARGVAAGAGGRVLGALGLVEAEALRWTGELESSLSALDRALALVTPGTVRWCQALAERALLVQRLGRSDELVVMGRTLLGRSVRDPPNDALAFALVRTALFCLLAGHGELSRQLADSAAHVESCGAQLEAPTKAQRHVLRAVSALYHGDFSTYLTEEVAARDSFDRAGDARRSLNESSSIGFAQLELGSYREAEATLEAALRQAQRLGLDHLKAASWHNLGLVYARLGRFDDARRVESQALELFRAQQDRRLEGAALTYLAEIALLAGDFCEAESLAREALALVARVAPPIEPLARGILAAALLARGAHTEALIHTTSAMASFAGGAAETGEGLVRLVHGNALDACGHSEDAERVRAESRARLLARAERIEDPSARRCFLEEVPEHAMTMALSPTADSTIAG